MDRFDSPLYHVRIAAPCKADWEKMIGTERVRFCGQCNLNVYNLSSMTKTEAETLIVQTEGRLCVRFFRRRDGSILTRNCPVGVRAIRRRLSYLAKATSAAVLSFLSGLGIYRITSEPQPTPIMGEVVIPEPINTPRLDIPIATIQGQMVLTAEEVGKISSVGMGNVSPQQRQNLVERKARRRRDRL